MHGRRQLSHHGQRFVFRSQLRTIRAEVIQKQTENAERKFDLNQEDLVEQINQLNTGLNNAIANESGCCLQGSDDDAFFACAAGANRPSFGNVTQPTPRPLSMP